MTYKQRVRLLIGLLLILMSLLTVDEGESRIRASYGDNYERLVQVKNKYDPTNFFHVNQNIKPTVK